MPPDETTTPKLRLTGTLVTGVFVVILLAGGASIANWGRPGPPGEASRPVAPSAAAANVTTEAPAPVQTAAAPAGTGARAAPTRASTSVRYVASALREVYHRPSCRWAQKIASSNLVSYASAEEAGRDKKRPCKVCKP